MLYSRRAFLFLSAACTAGVAAALTGCDTSTGSLVTSGGEEDHLMLPNGVVMAPFALLMNGLHAKQTVLDLTRSAYHVRLHGDSFLSQREGGLAVTLSMRDELRPYHPPSLYAADGDLLFLVEGRVVTGTDVHAGNVPVQPRATVAWYQRLVAA